MFGLFKSRKAMKTPLQEADAGAYAKFLVAWLQAGGKISHVRTSRFSGLYDHFVRNNRENAVSPLGGNPLSDIFIATVSCHVPDLYGSDAVSIVVWDDTLDVTTGGHNTILYPNKPDSASVEIFTDVANKMSRMGFPVQREHFTGDDVAWIEFRDASGEKIRRADCSKLSEEDFKLLAYLINNTAAIMDAYDRESGDKISLAAQIRGHYQSKYSSAGGPVTRGSQEAYTEEEERFGALVPALVRTYLNHGGMQSLRESIVTTSNDAFFTLDHRNDYYELVFEPEELIKAFYCLRGQGRELFYEHRIGRRNGRDFLKQDLF